MISCCGEAKRGYGFGILISSDSRPGGCAILEPRFASRSCWAVEHVEDSVYVILGIQSIDMGLLITHCLSRLSLSPTTGV